MMKKLALFALLLLAMGSPALAQNGYVEYGVVSTNPPAYVTGTNQPLSLDLSGNLRVVLGSGSITVGAVSQGTPGASPWLTSATTAGSVAAGTAATNSDLVGAVFNSSPITVANGQQAALQADANGYLNVHIQAGGGSGGTSSTFAAAFPSLGTAIGAKNGANMVNLTADGSNNLNVNCAVGCPSSTTTGSASGGTAATQSSLDGAIFNTSLPTLSNGQQASLQSDTNGRLIITLGTSVPAGNNVIGEVGGVTSSTIVTPTITSGSAYTAGFCLGGLMTVSNVASSRLNGPGTALLQSMVVTDASGQDVNLDVVLFNANPSNSTFTDHAACNVNAADLTKVIGVVHITDWSAFSANGTGQSQQQAMPITLGANNNQGWAQAITRGTPTYTGTSNLAFRFTTLQD